MKLCYEQKSIITVANTSMVNLSMDGICGACRALIRRPSNDVSSQGSQHQKGM